MSTLIQGKSELKIARIQENLAGGHKVPMLVLEYAENGKFRGQEGRHRAIVAVKRGEKEVPVMIVRRIIR